MLKGIVVVYL
jgi:hypothetical protein